MSCPSDDVIDAFVGGRLGPRERADLVQHTDGCAACHALVAAAARAPSKDDAPVFAAEDRVAGRYRIVRLIGRGGMGEVYEAEDLELHERVALKTLNSEVVSSERMIERFKREVQIARRVTHPNVCRVFDLGLHARTAGEPIRFITMELVGGETLGQRTRRGRMTLAEAGPILLQMAEGLLAAHRSGIVHRDFKSENVILAGPRVVVVDFGLARARIEGVPGLTASGGIMGTPAYMAPEQARGREATAASDVYALGVVLFEMLTAKRPFKADDTAEQIAAHLHQVPPRVRSINRDVPVEINRLIARMLAKPAEARPSLEEVAAVARAALAAPPPRPSSAAVVFAVVGTLAALGAATAAWLRWSRNSAPTPAIATPAPRTAPAASASGELPAPTINPAPANPLAARPSGANPSSLHTTDRPAANPSSLHTTDRPAANPSSLHTTDRPAANPSSPRTADRDSAAAAVLAPNRATAPAAARAPDRSSADRAATPAAARAPDRGATPAAARAPERGSTARNSAPVAPAAAPAERAPAEATATPPAARPAAPAVPAETRPRKPAGKLPEDDGTVNPFAPPR